MATVPMRDYLSLSQAVREYDYSRDSFNRLRDQGLLQFYKIGSKHYIRRTEFESLLQPAISVPHEKIQKTFV